MKKEEFIKQYGEAAYSEKVLEQTRQWRKANSERKKTSDHESSHKGGKYYQKTLKHRATGFQGVRNKIRGNHRHKWRQFKKVIAPDSQIHHQWIPGTAKYHGVALVEKDQHQYGIIDVIKIVDGEITLLTEEEIRNQGAE